MQESHPMKLYKYCRPERIDILRTGMIALSRPRVFNDPFDLSRSGRHDQRL
jgi:hypothetical protein